MDILADEMLARCSAILAPRSKSPQAPPNLAPPSDVQAYTSATRTEQAARLRGVPTTSWREEKEVEAEFQQPKEVQVGSAATSLEHVQGLIVSHTETICAVSPDLIERGNECIATLGHLGALARDSSSAAARQRWATTATSELTNASVLLRQADTILKASEVCDACRLTVIVRSETVNAPMYAHAAALADRVEEVRERLAETFAGVTTALERSAPQLLVSPPSSPPSPSSPRKDLADAAPMLALEEPAVDAAPPARPSPERAVAAAAAAGGGGGAEVAPPPRRSATQQPQGEGRGVQAARRKGGVAVARRSRLMCAAGGLDVVRRIREEVARTYPGVDAAASALWEVFLRAKAYRASRGGRRVRLHDVLAAMKVKTGLSLSPAEVRCVAALLEPPAKAKVAPEGGSDAKSTPGAKSKSKSGVVWHHTLACSADEFKMIFVTDLVETRLASGAAGSQFHHRFVNAMSALGAALETSGPRIFADALRCANPAQRLSFVDFATAMQARLGARLTQREEGERPLALSELAYMFQTCDAMGEESGEGLISLSDVTAFAARLGTKAGRGTPPSADRSADPAETGSPAGRVTSVHINRHGRVTINRGAASAEEEEAAMEEPLWGRSGSPNATSSSTPNAELPSPLWEEDAEAMHHEANVDDEPMVVLGSRSSIIRGSPNVLNYHVFNKAMDRAAEIDGNSWSLDGAPTRDQKSAAEIVTEQLERATAQIPIPGGGRRRTIVSNAQLRSMVGVAKVDLDYVRPPSSNGSGTLRRHRSPRTGRAVRGFSTSTPPARKAKPVPPPSLATSSIRPRKMAPRPAGIKGAPLRSVNEGFISGVLRATATTPAPPSTAPEVDSAKGKDTSTSDDGSNRNMPPGVSSTPAPTFAPAQTNTSANCTWCVRAFSRLS